MEAVDEPILSFLGVESKIPFIIVILNPTNPTYSISIGHATTHMANTNQSI